MAIEYEDINVDISEETLDVTITEETIDVEVLESVIDVEITEEIIDCPIVEETIDVEIGSEDIIVNVESWSCPPASSTGGELVEAELFVLNDTDISNKFVVLAHIPVYGYEINCKVKGAPSQHYGDDYKQDGTFLKRITWEGLGLSEILETGDKLTIIYTRNQT